MDNAIEACLERKSDKMFIILEISADKSFYLFKITNSGEQIKDRNFGELFEYGYSTKPGKGRGMGLYIVSRTLKKYHGRIYVESSPESTTFTIFIPGSKG